MLDILQFVFSGFWTFIGCLILLSVVAQGIVALAAILFRRRS